MKYLLKLIQLWRCSRVGTASTTASTVAVWITRVRSYQIIINLSRTTMIPDVFRHVQMMSHVKKCIYVDQHKLGVSYQQNHVFILKINKLFVV